MFRIGNTAKELKLVLVEDYYLIKGAAKASINFQIIDEEFKFEEEHNSPQMIKRESRALSQEVDTIDKTKILSEFNWLDQAVFDLDEEVDDIVLIEEEYKSILEESEIKKEKVTRKDFKFEKLIGTGAHAQVYLARKIDTNELFAIKVLDKLELNKKKQISGTKTERKILVSVCMFKNILGNCTKSVFDQASLCLSKSYKAVPGAWILLRRRIVFLHKNYEISFRRNQQNFMQQIFS